MIRTLLFVAGISLIQATSLDECRTLLRSPLVAANTTFFGNKVHGFFSQFVTHDRHYELKNVIKLKVLGSVFEGGQKTALCVGFVDTTSYTKNTKSRGSNPVAWVTMNTEAHVPTGLVEVDAECWALQGDLVPCSPQFYPMHGVMNTPLYLHSPLSEEFWPLLNDELLFANKWVWRMNTMSKEEKFPSSWVSNIKIAGLKELQIIGNDWGRVSNLLSPLAVLGRLDLSQNNITALAPDVLLNAPRLRDILLARNNLSEFPRNLDQLASLKLLDITNPWGDAELSISSSDVATIKGVDIIGLENVNLKADITGLLSLDNLKFLNLSGCRISRIDDIRVEMDAKVSEKSLTILDLSNNDLFELPYGLFSTLTKLKSLRLHRNRFGSCPSKVLGHLTDLDYLDISQNYISDIQENCFERLSKLEYLDLSWNRISDMSAHTLDRLPSLKTLKLAGNELHHLSPHMFSGRDKPLQLLDVSFNNLSRWSVRSDISHLNLSYNRITDLSQETFENLNRTSQVDLGSIPFNCCDQNLTLLVDWMRSTGSDIRTLGTKDLLECSAPGHNQKYPILGFKYGETLCSEGDSSVLLVIEDSPAWNAATIVMIIGVFLAILLIAIALVVGFLNCYRRKSADQMALTLP